MGKARHPDRALPPLRSHLSHILGFSCKLLSEELFCGLRKSERCPQPHSTGWGEEGKEEGSGSEATVSLRLLDETLSQKKIQVEE